MTRVISRFIVEGMIQEAPSGTINGSNVTFTLASTPESASQVELFLDGLYLFQTTDYSISSSTITMVTAPALGQSLRAAYFPK